MSQVSDMFIHILNKIEIEKFLGSIWLVSHDNEALKLFCFNIWKEKIKHSVKKNSKTEHNTERFDKTLFEFRGLVILKLISCF